MKALGSGIKQGVWFKDIEVLNHESQQPYVTFYNKALEIYNNLGCPKINVSISHSETTSVAIVILDKQE
jgi:holo-[acyl-carrier protein] synthase